MLVRKVVERFQVSERRGCGLVGIERSSHRYRSVRREAEAFVRRMRELALARPRYGYRRLYVLLRREGWKVNHKRVYRLYRAEDLSIRTRRRRKRVSEARLRPVAATRRNELWSLDFMADRLTDASKFRTLNAIDHATRTSPGIAVERGFTAKAVTGHLDRWIRQHGKPWGIVVDNGTEFTANDFDAWAHERGIAIHFITPGRPVENGLIESFNGKLRDECLNACWFESLEQAKEQIESWRRDYNEKRPHSSLGNIAPAQYAANLVRWAAG